MNMVLRVRASHVSRVRTNRLDNSFFPSTSKSWDDLDDEAKAKPSPVCFKDYLNNKGAGKIYWSTRPGSETTGSGLFLRRQTTGSGLFLRRQTTGSGLFLKRQTTGSGLFFLKKSAVQKKEEKNWGRHFFFQNFTQNFDRKCFYIFILSPCTLKWSKHFFVVKKNMANLFWGSKTAGSRLFSGLKTTGSGLFSGCETTGSGLFSGCETTGSGLFQGMKQRGLDFFQGMKQRGLDFFRFVKQRGLNFFHGQKQRGLEFFQGGEFSIARAG